MTIWDAHCHLSGVPGETPAERLGHLITFADRLGIERLCVFMGMKWSYDPSPEDMRRQNDEVLEAVRHWQQRAFGFVYLNPNHAEASLAELDRCVRDGLMVGVKLWVARHCNTPELDSIIQRATALKAPVLQHTYLKAAGNLPGESTPTELAELARRHPAARIICGHTGSDWEIGIRAIRACRVIHIDRTVGNHVKAPQIKSILAGALQRSDVAECVNAAMVLGALLFCFEFQLDGTTSEVGERTSNVQVLTAAS
jgi:hypothetical protein